MKRYIYKQKRSKYPLTDPTLPAVKVCVLTRAGDTLMITYMQRGETKMFGSPGSTSDNLYIAADTIVSISVE